MIAIRNLISRLGALFRSTSRPTPPERPVRARDNPPPEADEPRRAFVYIAGCRGLADLGRELGLAGVYKVGTTSNGDLALRLDELGRDRYGACYRGADGRQLEATGFTRWVVLAFAPSRAPRHPSITVLPRAIAVDLPAHLTPRAFDNALQTALVGRAIDRVQPAANRLTTYLVGDRRKPSAARELYAFEPRRDGDWLLEAVETCLQARQTTDRALRVPTRKAPAKRRSARSKRRLRACARASMSGFIESPKSR